MFNDVVKFIKELYNTNDAIPLHAPIFNGNEKTYLNACIDSTFVSSVGQYVTKFEQLVCEYTNSPYAVATTNGTSALHVSLLLAGVKQDDEVLTQAVTFVATANAISYIGAKPIFIDSASDNLGMCPVSLKNFLEENCQKSNGVCVNKRTNRVIRACVPMHTFGHPVKLDEIMEVCEQYGIVVLEDAAESLGSYYKGKHTGTIAPIGALSFNGNKIVTCGGGGMLLIKDKATAEKAKHITTTAKKPHPYEFFHDQVGYNYRLPNINAALACAQMEQLDKFLINKRETAERYKRYFDKVGVRFIAEPEGTKSNYWLNSIVLKNKNERDEFLKITNENGVMTRPIWKLMNKLPAFANCQSAQLTNANIFEERVINLPSSVRL